ncbi:MAG: tetratricopeptide repeat protein [Anaerolineales bacterium]|nr:tetratricopeptide repeat protein [Anaerolineales bacterium]MDW8162389.1 tetratricopeptide repeat protein [Anaerolineales bacterium]
MRISKTKSWLLLALALLIGGIGWRIWRDPTLQGRWLWRWERLRVYAQGVLDPVGPPPTPLPAPAIAITRHPTPTEELNLLQASPLPPTSTPTPLVLPATVNLPAPRWERQDINNCGPAALAMYLRYYGWEGDQFDISALIKPQREDRNVNVEELAYYVRNRAGWLNLEYRVGGDITLLKRLLAAGFPVMIEESFYFESPFYPNDDLWAAHYNLLTGYDEATQTFVSQNSYHGANLKVAYSDIQREWQVFNYLYILVFRPDQTPILQEILGEDWDVERNRQKALDLAQSETEADPQNAFAWFNLGTNLVYFERYPEAALAYDRARQLGLPQRMYRYQFGPFLAYFHTGRLDDLMAIVEYALKRTPNSEEALLWRGWAHYRQGKIKEAVADFRAALEQNPNYFDAQYALNFVLESH